MPHQATGRRRRHRMPFVVFLFSLLLASLTLTGAGSAGTARAAAVQPGTLAVEGGAYGTLARVGHTLKSGRSAPISIGGGGCTLNGQALPIHVENQIASVSVPALDTNTGVIHTVGDAFQTPTKLVVQTEADVHDVSLLGGLVTATEVHAVSQTTFNGTKFQTSANGSAFAALSVGGQSVQANVPPNTHIALAGVGQVVLNEQIKRVGDHSASLTVNMIHVIVTQQNILGYPIGSEIIVAHASSGIDQLPAPVVAIVDGHAYGTSAKGRIVSPAVIRLNSGESAPISVPCLGTNGETRENFVANVKVPSDGSVVDATTVRTTAEGEVGASSASAETTATVQAATLLQTLVQADAVKADAHASTSGGAPTFSDAGSGFATLTVAGHAEIGADVPPNTQVSIAGVGTLWLHRVIVNAHSIEVRMIELEVTVAGNPYGLSVGSDIRIAVASASVHNV
jgi:hypothetical protein